MAWITPEQATIRGPEKNDNDNTNTYNNDNALDTKETAITNRIEANIDKRINNTFNRASSSVADHCGT